MSHGYNDDRYERELEEKRTEKEQLEKFLLAFSRFRMNTYKEGARVPSFVSDEMTMIVTRIQSKLYELRHI